jgi:voltage-gated potassium channel
LRHERVVARASSSSQSDGGLLSGTQKPRVGRAMHLTWPVLSIILAVQVALGLLTGFVEGWSVGDALYFTLVTGLTIGYGDMVPRQALARALAIGIGVCGLFLTGVIAAIAVHAMRAALAGSDTAER